MAGMTIEVQAPIFVFREWHRHRTQSYNEASARYKPLTPLYYHIPNNFLWERCRSAAENTNRQAASASLIAENQLDPVAIAEWNEYDLTLSSILEDHYQQGLKIGIPKELARKKMPVDHYSCMWASANLRNWLAFMTLRCDPKAQWEIRQFANAVADIVKDKFPRTFKLWAEVNQPTS
jgi:thymidylate synthase (FAD)